MSTCDLNQEELALDPLAVLRCDPAVFRSGMASQQVILVNQQLTFQERVKFILNQRCWGGGGGLMQPSRNQCINST